MKRIKSISLFILLFLSLTCFSQNKENQKLINESTFSGLKFRNIGPAFMSGRIADVAIHPQNRNIWIVAVGSGGVWKTDNAGTTWKPVFDTYGSYSTGCVTIDEKNPNIVWLGTGENIGGRHVGYGDGVYKSLDGGETWTNMGLKESQHISKIIIHPNNSDIVWLAAQGPLWNKGGERGIYKTIDGGKTWKRTLGDNEWLGVTDIVTDPTNCNILYAATWQRHRNVAAYMGGGPGTGIYKSVDGGETWEKLTKGLPTSNMGKIGLAISPHKTNVLYAAIELDRRTGAIYKSENSGMSWVKQSEAVSGATGPHYYQELYTCPHQFDKLYLVDVRMQISEDGGKTFKRMEEEFKHSDNHSIAFRKDDPNYLLVGTDGGLYETFDLCKTWKYIPNLPVTQFYKLAVDDATPFYNIYGGTQDNSTQGGPSRTDRSNGILNSDWEIVLFADGHQPATEPGNPDIVYAEWQQGNLVRADRTTGEIVYIQPQPKAGEPAERFNWDAPILVSPHSATRLYYASQRVWRSDNRGDSWTPISGDLTKNQSRVKLPIMDKTWSFDSPWDLDAMSTYNTITSLAESPKQEGLIYAGTDDGIVQVTEDDGKNWRKIEVNQIPGVPSTSFVNDIKADLFDVNTVYIALDNHKFGDFNPYLFKSTDKGKTWKSIKGNIPGRTLVWRIVQDHIKPGLLFAATEFGIYFTIDGGNQWIKFTGNVPTISFRDLAIQRTENDLIAASFGRGFFILDDYSSLRQFVIEDLESEAKLFTTRDAWWYIQRSPLGDEEKGSFGAQLYTAPNPPFGAVFTYYLNKNYKTLKETRKEQEEKLLKENKNITFPDWDILEKELNQEKAKIWLTIKDKEGKVVNKIEGVSGKGFHRVAWDLTYASQQAIDPHQKNNGKNLKGPMVMPGEYSVCLTKEENGVVTDLSSPVSFNVKQMRKGALKGSTAEETVTFWLELEDLFAKVGALSLTLNDSKLKIDAMAKALNQAKVVSATLTSAIYDLKQQVIEIEVLLYGQKSKRAVSEPIAPTIYDRLSVAQIGTSNSTYGPTETHKMSYEIALNDYLILKNKMEQLVDVKIPQFENELISVGAPWIKGQSLKN